MLTSPEKQGKDSNNKPAKKNFIDMTSLLFEGATAFPANLEGRIVLFLALPAKPDPIAIVALHISQYRFRLGQSGLVFQPEFGPGIEGRKIADPARGKFVDHNGFYAAGLQQVFHVENYHPIFVGEDFFHARLDSRINS